MTSVERNGTTRSPRSCVPLVAPCITDIDRQCMHNAIELGLLEHGLREVERFEEMFAARVGCEWAIAVSSGTSALTVALRALDFAGPVRVPSWSCVAIRNAVDALPRQHVLVDLAWNVRYACAAWTDDQRLPAVVPHMFGRDTVFSIIDAAVVEDWTLSLGGCYALVGDLGVCSTYETKMITTGRGGVIFGDDQDLHARVRELVHYETHTGFGYSMAMSPLQAALGVSQLAQLDRFVDRRRELATRYTEAFRPAGIECPNADCGSVFFRYLIAVASPEQAVASLSGRGIEAGRGVFPPLHTLAGLSDDEFPGTAASVASLLSVPVHPSITDEQADWIIEHVLQECAP